MTPRGLMVNAEEAEIIRLLEELIGAPDTVLVGRTWCG